VLSGFTPDELQLLDGHLEAIWPGCGAQLLPTSAAVLKTPVAGLAAAADAGARGGGANAAGGPPQSHGRVVLFLGGPAQQTAAYLNVSAAVGLGSRSRRRATCRDAHAPACHPTAPPRLRAPPH
jgi:hypothetical protein